MKRRQFGVIGLGRFGSAMATTLTELGHDVIGVDADESRVQRLADVITHALQIDATDEKALRACGMQDVDVAVVSIGENIESSLLVVMQLRELGIETIVAKAVTPLHGRILEKLGVSRVIFPEREMAIRTAHSLVIPNVIDYIELSRDFSIVEVPAPDAFVGRTLRQLELRPRLGLTLIAIKRKPTSSGPVVTNIAPAADEVIRHGDILALLGSNERLNQLDQLLGR
ncbi:MAG TPA: TrkA family potassium uptake protein [Vicinamibacterales bacterium]|nr:TrkA family potassium uptake protein [Vicinamibacterales bacterium]